MSSLLDTAMQSDAASMMDTPRPTPGGQRRPLRDHPSVRTPGINTPGVNSDMLGFGDDDVVGLQGQRRLVRDVEQVVDTTGEALSREFEAFLNEFVDDTDADDAPLQALQSSVPASKYYYVEQVKGLARYGLSTLYVDFQHVMQRGEGDLATAILNDYYRYHPYMIRALHNVISKHAPRYFRQHRQPHATTASTAATAGSASTASNVESSTADQTPNQQTDKIFALAFYNLPLISRVRQLRTESIGNLLSISGTVTRTSEVRPELSLATFVCEMCNSVVPNVEQIFRYSEPTQCPNHTCGNRQAWRLDIRQSTFIDWQKVRVQENSSEIPTGSMPRTMDVILRGEMVDRAKAGEKCIFTGALIVVPDVSQFRVPGVRPQAARDAPNARGADAGGSGVSGLKALGVRDLTYRMAFLANMVTPDNSTAGQQAKGSTANILSTLNQAAPQESDALGEEAQRDFLATLTRAEIDDLKAMVHTPNIFMRLVESLAPMVYGHTVVKKGLLLQLMGGVGKVTPEGMQLRGDINICIVGDPSTSKSQFLKYICSFLPRAVYTSGKASSAAGLTAAVVKDEETGDFTIEAGALMLADNGICAIDEFDKMDIADQVAIHEAMEQQTISIAKAGIQATLNARTSILAAANPVGGRYNRKTTLRANINMSAPIMSRFDLFFVVLDECNEQVDRHLAQHIVDIHRLRDAAVEPEFSTEQLQRYIRFARLFQPVFTEEAKATLVERYKELRADDAQGGIGRNSYRITVRQLESMIRLSEAIAKANCVADVIPDFVNEAFRLLRQSIISVEKDDVDVDDDDDEFGEGEVDEYGDREMGDDAFLAASTAAEAEAANRSTTPSRPSQRVQITHDKYQAMLNLFIRRVGEEETEQSAGDAGAEGGAGSGGVEQEELVTWYLEQREDELESQEDLERERALAGKVLKRLVKDNILMQIRGEGLADDEGRGLQSERVVYVLHPNCAIEDI